MSPTGRRLPVPGARALDAAKLVLAPVLLVQGLHVRRKALVLPEPEGARLGEVDPPHGRRRHTEPLRLLVVGDSSAAGVGVAHQREALASQVARALAEERGQPVHWQLVAKTGNTTLEALAQARESAVQPADILLTVVGVNDVVRQVPVSRSLANLSALHTWARQEAGVRYWAHSGLPPMHQFPLLPRPLRWVLGGQAEHLNRALHATLGDQRDRGLCRIPTTLGGAGRALMAADGFHPGVRGYALWAETLGHYLARRWARVGRR